MKLRSCFGAPWFLTSGVPFVAGAVFALSYDGTTSQPAQDDIVHSFSGKTPGAALREIEPVRIGSGVTTFPTRADFDAACPGLPVEDFEDGFVAPFAVCSDAGPLNNATNDSCFPAGAILLGIELQASPTGPDYASLGDGFAGNPTVWVGANLFSDAIVLVFNPPVTAVAFDLYDGAIGNDIDIQLFDSGGGLIDVAVRPSGFSFYGAKSLTPIAQIVVAGQNDGGDLIDNLAFNGIRLFTTRADFNDACPGLPVEDFEETLVPSGAVNTCPAPLNENTNDACFQPGDILPGLQINVAGGGSDYAVLGDGFAGNPTVWVGTDLFVDGTALEFSPPVIALGVDVFNPLGPGVIDIQLFDNDGALISSLTVPAATPSFFGVKSITPIARAVVAGLSDSGDLVDNVAFGATECQPCPWDLDGSGSVGITDLLALLAAWGTDPGGPPDLDGDGNVGINDLLILLAAWGPCP